MIKLVISDFEELFVWKFPREKVVCNLPIRTFEVSIVKREESKITWLVIRFQRKHRRFRLEL